MKNYLDISKAESLKDSKEKFLYRFLEIIPGFLSWITLIGAFFLSWLTPTTVAIFIILFDLYWLLKIVYLSFHQIASFKQMRKNLKTDWLEKLEQLNEEWNKIYHLIVLPMYNESKEIVESSCQAISDCQYPKDRMIVVLAIEERAGKSVQKMTKEIEKRFSKKFLRFLITVHPKNIPGEIKGKGSNAAWAIKTVKKKIIEPLKIKKENIIVSSFDIDTKPYPQYFACLTFHYLTIKNPYRASYQPIPVYNNNIWSAPNFSRLVATSNTFWQMMQQERPEALVTYSSHSVPFCVLEQVGYPKNVVPDDSRIFWKSYLFYDGDYRVIPIHYPVSMDAVLAKNLSRTIINQYKQQRRWAWGCVDIPFLLFGFLKNKKISLSKKLYHCWNILDGFWSWAVASLLIFFLGWLPLVLGGEKFNITLLSYNLPRATRSMMTISMIGMLVSSIISFLILPPKPKKFGKLKDVSLALQWLMLPITLIFFGGIPALDAQTRLIFGKRLGFWVTEKARL
ncbi:MAG: glycosyltransferase family 2 protein [Candidatus Nealsonbacteria bacterium]|nr:MAG: glycosyltransferase family 2 protein [Candidatus Nealsonbacteria bacterium]